MGSSTSAPHFAKSLNRKWPLLLGLLALHFLLVMYVGRRRYSPALDGTASSIGVDQVYRFHSGVNQDIDGDIVWNGNTYSRYPIEAGGFEYEGQGQLPRPQISISNVLSLMTTLVLEYNDLVGATVKRIRTLNASFPEEVFIIDRKVIENRELVTFELSATFDVAGVKLPRRQIVQNICPWTYKGEGCGYSGTDYYDINDQEVTDVADDVCSHRLTGCRARFGENGQLPYGGFPSAGLIG